MPHKVVDTFWQCEVDQTHKHKTEREALICERKHKLGEDLDNIESNKRFENTLHEFDVEETEEDFWLEYEPPDATSIDQVMVVRTSVYVQGHEENTYRRKVQVEEQKGGKQ